MMSLFFLLFLLNCLSFANLYYDYDYDRDFELPMNGKSLKIIIRNNHYIDFKLDLQKKVPKGTEVHIRFLEVGNCSDIVMKSDYGKLNCYIGKYHYIINSFKVEHEDLGIINFNLFLGKFAQYGHMIILICEFDSNVISKASFIIFSIILLILLFVLMIKIYFFFRNCNLNNMDSNKIESQIGLIGKDNYEEDIRINGIDGNELHQKEIKTFEEIKQKIGFNQVYFPENNEEKKLFKFRYICSIIISIVSLIFLFLCIIINPYYDKLRRYIFLELFFIFYIFGIIYNLFFLDYYNSKVVDYKGFCNIFEEFLKNKKKDGLKNDIIKSIYDVGGTFILPESNQILIRFKRNAMIYNMIGRENIFNFDNNIYDNKDYYILLSNNISCPKINIYSILSLLTFTAIFYDLHKKKECIYYELKKLYILKEKLSDENQELLKKITPGIYYNKKVTKFKNITYIIKPEIKKEIIPIEIPKIIEEINKIPKLEKEPEYSKVYDLHEFHFRIILYYWKNKSQFNVRIGYYDDSIDTWVNKDENQLQDGRKIIRMNGPEDQYVVDYVKFFPYPIYIWFNDLSKDARIKIENIISS